jgi:lysylphosphatidylglycerol synthetase-like protein (DUF2156 family)
MNPKLPQQGPRSVSAPTLSLGLALVAIVLFVVRHDIWQRETVTLVAGLPISLLYHLIFCFAVSAVLAAFLFGRRKSR